MKRKEFLAKLSLGAGAALLAPMMFNSCEKSEDEPDNGSNVDFTIDLTDSRYSDLQNEGGYVYENNIIIVNLRLPDPYFLTVC